MSARRNDLGWLGWLGWSRCVKAVLLVAVVIARGAVPGQAYAGPGAGFAVLSSFLLLILVFFSALFSIVAWPFRFVIRWLRGRKALAKAKTKRVVIVGFDGMDPELTEQYMKEGKLPNLTRMRKRGSYCKLGTTYPPISPVAWSTFLTGVNPGQHNIYDFLAQSRATYMPYLSSAEIRDPKRTIKIGGKVIPLGRPRAKMLRKSRPFWNYLADAGVFSSVIRVPITFPPEKFSGVLLSGMCVPDLRGSQGTFSFFSTRPRRAEFQEGGRQFPLERRDGWVHGELGGPKSGDAGELKLPFRLRAVDGARAELKLDGRTVTLEKGKYTEWLKVGFPAGLGMKVPGICRLYLKECEPEVELYVTPVNIDPARPALPISHPLSYSIYLSKLQGPFATLGLAEDTWALNEKVLDNEAFLDQCYTHHEEREKMFIDALDKTRRGLCVCVFDTTDRVQHMFWRYLESDHPANQNGDAKKYGGVIEDLYIRMDDLVGRTQKMIDDDTVFIVLSDHGFKSFQRGFNLNGWLRENGYLALKDGCDGSRDWYQDIDWTRTRAFGFGLNGLHINQTGRDRQGTVGPGAETESLKRELSEKLRGLQDSAGGKEAIREVYDSTAVLRGPYVENAPDLMLGYNPGFRVSWDSVLGKVKGAVFEDNCKAWSGDHCLDPEQVPGIIFSSHKIEAERPAIVDVAPTVLDLFGVQPPAHMNSKPWRVSIEPAN